MRTRPTPSDARCARRCGWRPIGWNGIGGFLLTAGGADEFCHLYAGRVVAPPADGEGIVGFAGEAAESEDIRVRVWDAGDAIAAAFAGYFVNSITAMGLFWLAARRDWLRQKWMAG